MKPSSSSCARMLRTVADETVTPEALTRSEEGTGSPSAMYSRTRAARIRLDRSDGSISTRELRLLSNYTLQPAKHFRRAGEREGSHDFMRFRLSGNQRPARTTRSRTA